MSSNKLSLNKLISLLMDVVPNNDKFEISLINISLINNKVTITNDTRGAIVTVPAPNGVEYMDNMDNKSLAQSLEEDGVYLVETKGPEIISITKKPPLVVPTSKRPPGTVGSARTHHIECR